MKRLILLVLVIIALWGCDEFEGPVYSRGEYRVEGQGTANLDYDNLDDLGAERLYHVALPWSKAYTFEPDGQDYYLGAQSNDSLGILIVSLWVDGVLVETKCIRNPYGFVAIYGMLAE
jgi:hypothetical protein